jgi:hypothetical protein
MITKENKMKRVKVGSLYTFTPVLFDLDVRIERDMIVRVIELPGAPKANEMGFCYVADPYTCKFFDMVRTDSLTPLRKIAESSLIAKINQQATHSPRYGQCACGKRIAEDSKIPPYHKSATGGR